MLTCAKFGFSIQEDTIENRNKHFSNHSKSIHSKLIKIFNVSDVFPLPSKISPRPPEFRFLLLSVPLNTNLQLQL